jgi:hypothetical protein
VSQNNITAKAMLERAPSLVAKLAAPPPLPLPVEGTVGWQQDRHTLAAAVFNVPAGRLAVASHPLVWVQPVAQLTLSDVIVLPLHRFVMSASQHVPATLPLIELELVLRCWPEGQVKPEQASSQHAATVLPVMEAELAL